MKKFLLGLLVFATAPLIAQASPHSDEHSGVCVVIKDFKDLSWDYGTATNLRDVNGTESRHSGYFPHHYYTVHYRVAVDSSNHHCVLAHYTLKENGRISEIDKAIPIFEKAPASIQWTKINDRLVGYAFMVAPQQS